MVKTHQTSMNKLKQPGVWSSRYDLHNFNFNLGFRAPDVGSSVVTIPQLFVSHVIFPAKKPTFNQQKFHETWVFSPTKRMHFVTCLPRNLSFLVHGTGPTRPHLAVWVAKRRTTSEWFFVTLKGSINLIWSYKGKRMGWFGGGE